VYNVHKSYDLGRYSPLS